MRPTEHSGETKRTPREKAITSADNSLFRTLQDCLVAKGIKKHGLFLLSGERAVRESIAHRSAKTKYILFNEADRGLAKSLIDDASGDTPASVSLANDLFKELDVFGTRAPILVLETPELPEADLSVSPSGLEVLCSLSDPSNVGALVRSSAAFGASRLVFLKESATPFHPRAVRAASASIYSLPMAKGPSILDLASLKTNAPIVALDMSAPPIHAFEWPKNARLLMGEEGQGLPPSSAFRTVSIPIARNVESLNATVAASIALYSYRMRFPL